MTKKKKNAIDFNGPTIADLGFKAEKKEKPRKKEVVKEAKKEPKNTTKIKRYYQQTDYQRTRYNGDVPLRQCSFLLRADVKEKLTEIANNSQPKKSVGLLLNEILMEKLKMK